MKTKLIVLVTLTALFACRKNNTEQQQGEPSFLTTIIKTDLKDDLSDVHFIERNTGIGITLSGKIYRTTNAGVNWNVVYDDSIDSFKDLFISNKTICYVAGGQSADPKSIVLKSVDGGQNWQKQTIPNKISTLSSLYFINTNLGFAVGDGLTIKTSDGGKTWQEFSLDFDVTFTKIQFVNPGTGFICGTNGAFYKTTDAGKNWFKIDLKTSKDFGDLNFISEDIGYLGDIDFYESILKKTTDGGNTWEDTYDYWATSKRSYFIDSINVIFLRLVGPYYDHYVTLFYSSDGGRRQYNIHHFDEYNLVLTFPEKLYGYAIGNHTMYSIDIRY